MRINHENLLHEWVGDTPESMTLVRITDLLRRTSRGMLYYERCCISELTVSVADRHLTLPTRARVTSNLLISILEHAGDHLNFDRFTDLPPELRVRIYENHFMSFRFAPNFRCHVIVGVPLRHAQPPLALVSGGIRHETLSIFHSTCMFTDMKTRSLVEKAVATTVPPSIFSALKNLRLGMDISTRLGSYYITVTIKLPLSVGKCESVVTKSYFRLGLTEVEEQRTGDLKPYLENVIQYFVDNVLAAEAGKLHPQDMKDLMSELKRACDRRIQR